MSSNNRYRTLVDKFRARSEDNYIFACQASVPLLLTRDLLYQLWNNFKRYQYGFNSQETFKISHIAISDLLLSPLCREVGHELYEIPKEARDLLFEELVLNLGEKRKNTIAAFLEEYALLEQHFSRRKRLKSIHLLTALSILDPHEMEKQIIVQINEAKTDQEKLNLLLLHRHLVPLGFESDLGKISSAAAGADQSFSPILIAEEDPEAPGVLNVTLPVALRNRVRRTKRLQEAEAPAGNSKALELIARCMAEKSTHLDLGGLGLNDADFGEHSPINAALQQCTELRTLILSNEWYDWLKRDWQYSDNHEGRNHLSVLPPVVQYLSQLSTFICGGDHDENWSISDITPIRQLEQLTCLNLSRNKIEVITGMQGWADLQILSLAFNSIKEIDGEQLSDQLSVLDLRYNQLEDIAGLIPLVKRSQHPMKLYLRHDDPQPEYFIAVTGNPFVTKYAEVFDQDDKAIMEFVDAQAALSQTTNKNDESIWHQIRIICTDIAAEPNIQLQFSITDDSTDLEGNIFVDRNVIDEIIHQTDYRTWTATKGKALLELLIPASFEKYFDGRYHLILILDETSALYPWELIVGPGPLNLARPLCFHVKIIRQITVDRYQVNIPEQGRNSALIIGNPVTDGFTNPLPNTAEEAAAVAGILSDAGLMATLLNGQPAEVIISSLFSVHYGILHIAALSQWSNQPNEQEGIVIGSNIFLKSKDFQQLETIPDLIFLNCSHLGRTSMAIELIRFGAKAVIVSPDDLDDKQAVIFSTTFYRGIAEGLYFADAAVQARQTMFTPGSTDFFPATYQCYGDPFYRLMDTTATTDTSAAAEEKKKTGQQRSLLVAWLMSTSRQTIGTGFLVSREMLGIDIEDELLLMTCWHVVAEEPSQPTTLAPTDFIARFDALNEKETFSLTEVVWASAADKLDAALLRFEKSSHDRLVALTHELNFYPVAEKIPGSNEGAPPEIFIIGYPEGQGLKIIDEGCVLFNRSDRLFIQYSRVTRPGGAGSPVFNANWELIGLQHAGSNEMKTLNRTGIYAASEGISIHAIMEQVKKDLGTREVHGIKSIRILLIPPPAFTPVTVWFRDTIKAINDGLQKQNFHLETVLTEKLLPISHKSPDQITFADNIDIGVIVSTDVSELNRYMQAFNHRYLMNGKPIAFFFLFTPLNSEALPDKRYNLDVRATAIGFPYAEVSSITEMTDIFIGNLIHLDIFKDITFNFNLPKSRKKVFFASTDTNLEKYSSIVANLSIELFENFQFITDVDPDSLGQWDTNNLNQNDITRCDIVILLVGDKYGYIPRGQDRSLTEIVLDLAVKYEKTILVFLVSETSVVDAAYSNLEKLKNLKHRLSPTVFVKAVRSPKELESSLRSAIQEFEKSRYLKINKRTGMH